MTRLAFDRATVRAYDREGRLHVRIATLTKAVVSPYLGSEIPDCERLGLDPRRTYQMLRDPDALAKSVPTWNNLPLLSDHAPTSADEPQKGLVCGSTGTDARFDMPRMLNSLVIWDGEAIAGVESGDQRELSCGYRYDPLMQSGTFEGQPYDGCMVNIVGNHVALVPEGRVPGAIVGDGTCWPPTMAQSKRLAEQRWPGLARIRLA